MAGILGTVSFHLALLIVFFIFKIKTAAPEQEAGILVQFQDEKTLVQEKPEVREEKKLEAQYERMARSNIGVNVADKLEKEISTKAYESQLKQELYDQRPEDRTREYLNELEKKLNREKPVPGDEGLEPAPGAASHEKKKPYTGPTNIYYNLPGRHSRYLAVPVYLCEGNGKVTLNISVNQEGQVINVNFAKENSTVDDPCLYEAAEKAALSTLFNIDMEAASPQHGTITYHFVAQ